MFQWVSVVRRLGPDDGGGGGEYTLTGLLGRSLVTLSPPAAMPRVVANQRERFDNDELFRKLSRDMEASIIRHTNATDK